MVIEKNSSNNANLTIHGNCRRLKKKNYNLDNISEFELVRSKLIDSKVLIKNWVGLE